MNRNLLSKVIVPLHGILAVGVVACLAAAPALRAQEAPKPEEMKPVVVTGTYLESSDAAGTLTVTPIEMSVPINQGFSTLGDVLRVKLPQYGGPGNLNPAFGNGGDGNSYLSLRGLPGNATLVLVNGRRTAISALNQIPDAAIDHIEVLNDGASPIYGSDAVAGVVNIILKKEYQGTKLSSYVGWNDRNPSVNERKFKVLTGVASDKASAVFSSEYSAADGLLSPNRPVSALSRGLSGTSNPGTTYSSTDLSGSGLVPLTWHVNPAVTFGLTSSNQIPAGFNPLAYIPTGLSTSQKNAIIAASNAVLGATSPVLYGNSSGFPYPRYTTLYRPSEKYDFSGSGEYKLIGDHVKLFADAYYVNYRSQFQLAPSPLSPLLRIPSANYWFQQVFPAYVSPTNGLTQSYRAVELGPRVYTDQFEDFRFVGGLRGKIAESSWNWEAGYLFTKNSDLQQAAGGIVRSDLDALLQSSQPGAWNPFGYTPLFGSSAVNGNTVQAFAGSAYLQYIFKVQGLDFRFGGNVLELPAGPLGVSFGAESRRESFDQIPDLATKNALISPFNAIPPLSAMRNVYSGYGEAVVPIFGKDLHLPLVNEFSVSGAARYEDYSDVGDTGVKPRVSGRWKVLEQEEWTFRGSWAQGFSAPSFSSLYSAPSQNFYEVYNPYSGIREQPITGAFEEGNRNLKPTKSETWLVGTSWSPKVIKGLTIGMDYYSIEQNGIPFKSADYIVNQWFNAGGNSNPANPWGPNAPPSGANPAGTQIDYNSATGQFQEIRHLAYINAGKRETDGIDLNLSQEFDFDFGKFTLSGMATRMLSFKQQDLPGGPTIDYLGRYWDNSAALADTSYPDWRANITLSYQYKRITAAAGFNYTSGYTENYNGQDLKVSDYPTLDLRIGYRIPGIEADLLVGVNNVTDELPRVVLSSFENNSDRAIADPRGRMFFASLSKEF